MLEKDLKSAIQKSRSYSEQKEEFQNKLMAQKQRVEALQLQVVAACSLVSKYMLLVGVLHGRRRLVKLSKLTELCSVEIKKRSEARFSFT